MNYTIKAIPTTYKHTVFRSRLEARWAAFFDLAGWEWDYEPFDLSGWAPDFLLKGKVKALVEVKPIDFGAQEESAIRQAQTQAAKAFRTAQSVVGDSPGDLHGFPPQYEIAIVGNGPFINGRGWSLGVFALETMNAAHDIADLYVGKGEAQLDYAARTGSFRYRIGGQHDGDHHLHDILDTTPQDMWREAGNTVQWNSPRTSKAAA